jgi:hypothetical protein
MLHFSSGFRRYEQMKYERPTKLLRFSPVAGRANKFAELSVCNCIGIDVEGLNSNSTYRALSIVREAFPIVCTHHKLASWQVHHGFKSDRAVMPGFRI